ncbi:MAG: ATP-binding protein [Acidobacteria bacterium]|nr:ATP-binding protein [Acidobacteriota bacterium]
MERLAQLATEHLLLRMRRLNRSLKIAVDRQRQANRALAIANTKGVYLTDTQAETLLARVDAFVHGQPIAPVQAPVSDEEAPLEKELRSRVITERQLLPLDRLAELGVSRAEQDAIALCAAPELDRAYERIYGYILDDLTRRAPSVALLQELTAETAAERAWSLHAFGPFGRLRRRGLLIPSGQAESEARQALRLGAGVLDYLITGRGAPAATFSDPAELDVPTPIAVPIGVDAVGLEKIATALRTGAVDVVGVWGPTADGLDDIVRALCSRVGTRVRRLVMSGARGDSGRDELGKALLACETLHSLLWVDIRRISGEGDRALFDALEEHLAASTTPVVMSGCVPWRPTRLVAARSYYDWEVRPAEYPARKAMWLEAVPGVDQELRQDLAARFRLTSRELQAATRLAGVEAMLASNGRPSPLARHLENACTRVTQRDTVAFARVIKPRRRAADLMLPEALHEQVLEISRFHRTWPRVAEEWGLSTADPAAGALKALFTGDSGTGKTLAAEVVASEMGAVLIKVDLARLVSKWIGETEKNLSAVFDEARNMHAVLFFDEADALFGRRGEVHRGTDRYANLEVSYLLQRVEEHDSGVVILASNLKENIDTAFTRRFQVTIHFPRPSETLRRRLWRAAVPQSVPLDGVDFDALAGIDLTGGGIAGAARSALILAAGDKSKALRMEHLVQGLARQVKREARLLTSAELGPYACLLRDA